MKPDSPQLAILEKWLKSYKPEELFDIGEGFVAEKASSVVPKNVERQMGMLKVCYLYLALWTDFSLLRALVGVFVGILCGVYAPQDTRL
jgi:hypothetical protein